MHKPFLSAENDDRFSQLEKKNWNREFCDHFRRLRRFPPFNISLSIVIFLALC